MATSLQPVKSWKKPVEVVKGWILADWAQKYPEPWNRWLIYKTIQNILVNLAQEVQLSTATV
jgi:hypothetical protein